MAPDYDDPDQTNTFSVEWYEPNTVAIINARSDPDPMPPVLSEPNNRPYYRQFEKRRKY